jgi:hypothetical protein
MKNRIDILRVYHYLFCYLPGYRVNKNAAKPAAQITEPLVKAYQLTPTEISDSPFPGLTQLWNSENEKANSRLLQFLFKDILITELVFRQREDEDASPEFFARYSKINFPQSENLVALGEATVFFARGRSERSTAEQIVQECFQEEVEERLPICQLTWGTLHFIPGRNLYILLFPETDGAGEADTFLISGLPVLESICRKLKFESEKSKHLFADNFKIEYEIEHLLPPLLKKPGEEEESLPSAEQMSERLTNLQNRLYNNISKIERTLYGMERLIRYFEKHLAAFPIKVDILFQPQPDEFCLNKDHIERDLRYTRLLLPGIEKLQEAIRLKFDLLRQKTLEKNNRLLEHQNMLIAVFAGAIGVGLILPDMNWIFKLLSMVTSGAVTLVVLRSFHPRN